MEEKIIVNLSCDELIFVDHVMTAIEQNIDEASRVLKRSPLEVESDIKKLLNSIKQSTDFYEMRW